MKKYSEISSNALIKERTTIEHPVHISSKSELHNGCSLGRFSFINSSTVIFPNTSIGRYCSIARNCEIGAANHPIDFLSSSAFSPNLFPKFEPFKNMKRHNWVSHPPTKIGNDVWIGAKVVIKAGIEIADGCVVAAGAVVTSNFPAYSIIGGVPARLIRPRFPQHQIDRLMKVKWWDREFSDIQNLPLNDIDKCLELLENNTVSN